MKVVYFLRNIYPYEIGGVEITYYYLLPYLEEKSITPIIISEYKSDKYKTWRLKKIWPYSIFVKIQLLYILFFKRKEYDMIHIPFMHTTSYLNWVIFPFVKKLLKKQYVISIHGGRMAEWKPQWPFLLFFNNAKRISATSVEIANEYKKRTGKNITVIPSNIPFVKSNLSSYEILFKNKLKEGKKYFLTVGSFKEIKSPLTILKAVSALRESGFMDKYNLHFLFAGNGPDREIMEKYIKDNYIGNYVTLLGNIDRNDIPNLYKISFAYIIASEFESFSISMFEAIFNKVPIINTNVKVLNSLLKDNITSLFFDYGDNKGLSNCIKRLIVEKGLRESLVEAAYEKYKNYFNYNQRVVKPYYELYL